MFIQLHIVIKRKLISISHAHRIIIILQFVENGQRSPIVRTAAMEDTNTDGEHVMERSDMKMSHATTTHAQKCQVRDL